MLKCSAQCEPDSLADVTDFAGKNVKDLRIRRQVQHRVRSLFRGKYPAQLLIPRTSFEGSLELNCETLCLISHRNLRDRVEVF